MLKQHRQTGLYNAMITEEAFVSTLSRGSKCETKSCHLRLLSILLLSETLNWLSVTNSWTTFSSSIALMHGVMEMRIILFS